MHLIANYFILIVYSYIILSDWERGFCIFSLRQWEDPNRNLLMLGRALLFYFIAFSQHYIILILLKTLNAETTAVSNLVDVTL